MELNLCLYCEKRLADDNMAFCSISCQSNEASKSYASYKHASLSTSLSATRPPFFLMQSLSTSSSFSSSISDVSVFSTSCSCEDKAGNICPPYHITRTTHNIAS
ncbi:hypothetical protein EDC94DRAFT_546287 [Helicostylum pulchrum]|nr:hypothetical protein EDC94DRAFT_546287 [Helicostylum pulchrum]